MASIYSYTPLSLLFLFFSLYSSMAALVKQQPLILKYHNGPLLSGKIAVNLIWYGNFTPTQRSIIVDFISSLSSPLPPPPSAASWWRTTAKYTRRPSTLAVGDQILYQNYPFGKTLKNSDLLGLASKPKPRPTMDGSIHVVLTAADVAVEGFCMRCGTHGWTGGPTRMAYIWVGNSVNQCPGQCAWPFHQPIYGPQTAPLVPPNGDVGVDGMVINLGKLLAGTVTNPYSNGYFQGPAAAPLEAATACTGVFGSGAYPGYTGRVMVDDVSGASYNAQGVKGRRFMLPAMWDPQSLGCATLV